LAYHTVSNLSHKLSVTDVLIDAFT